MAAEPRIRKSAEQRREEILSVAVRHFAIGGLHGTSTEAIAREAGISQPYLFRLFRTKRDLFLACFGVVHERIHETFRSAAEGVPKEDALASMGKAYVRLLEETSIRLFQMQAYAACSDPVIRKQVRDCYATLVKQVTRLSGAPPEAVWQFFAHGMLLNVIASLDLAAIADSEPWAKAWLAPLDLIPLP